MAQVGLAASEWLAAASVSDLEWVLRQTCHTIDQPLLERIAIEMVEWQRAHEKFTSTLQFTAMLKEAEKELRREQPNLKLPSLVKTSLRIFLNQEMPQLTLGLEAAFEHLATHGRCCIICFNRWETTAVWDADHTRASLACPPTPARPCPPISRLSGGECPSMRLRCEAFCDATRSRTSM